MKLNGSSLEQHLTNLKCEGYTIISDFLSIKACDSYAKSLDAMIKQDAENEARDIRDTNMVHNPMFRDSSFYDVLRTSSITELLTRILGESLILYAFTTSSLPPQGTNWARRVHVDCPRLIPGYPTNMNVFIPLSGISELNGGIEVLPQSHWREQIPSPVEFSTQREVPKMTTGSALVFYSRLWHSAGTNHSDTYRHALTMNFCRSYMRQRFDYPRMVPELDRSRLDEMQRQLLGFSVRVPSSMEEYYLPEAERLYKPNQG